MNRLTRFTLPAILALAVLIPSLASADRAPKRVDVGWHTSLAASSYTAGDSATINYSSGAQRCDTSATIDIGQFVLPEVAQTSAVDSLGWLRIAFFPSSSATTATADSIGLNIQVSENGTDWTSVSAFTRSFYAAGLNDNLGLIVLETGSSNQFTVAIRQSVGGGTHSVYSQRDPATTAPNWLQIYGYPFMRIIVQSDIAGTYDAAVTGLVSD